MRPFTDGVWTTAVQPGNPYGDAVNASYPELAVLVAALSAGPVAIGDGLGLTNASLVAATCMADGRLLRPSAGATFLDGQVGQGHGSLAGGIEHSTLPAHSAYRSMLSSGTSPG